MKGNLTTAMFLLLLGTTVKAQLVKAIGLGEQLSNLPITISLNNKGAIKQVADLKGKVVIFDFWNTTCTSCIEAFPKLETLQNQFAGKLVVLTVTRDSREKVEALFSRSRASRTTLPIITNDTTFIKYFTVKQPHHAWLDALGRVLAVAHSYNATAANIQSAINGNSLNLPLLTQIRGFNTKIPLAVNPAVAKTGLLKQYSMLTPFINGILMDGGSLVDSASKKIIWRSFYNKSILSLLKFAYGNFREIDNPLGSIYDSRHISLDVRDTARYLQPQLIEKLDAWRYANFYCYEIALPEKNAEHMAAYMQQDLQRFFQIKVELRKRTYKAYELRDTQKSSEFKSEGGMDFITEDKKYAYLWNQNFKQIAAFLNRSLENKYLPFTGADSTTRLDLTLEKHKLKDSRDAIAYLRSLGLALIEVEIEQSYLHIVEL